MNDKTDQQKLREFFEADDLLDMVIHSLPEDGSHAHLPRQTPQTIMAQAARPKREP